MYPFFVSVLVEFPGNAMPFCSIVSPFSKPFPREVSLHSMIFGPPQFIIVLASSLDAHEKNTYFGIPLLKSPWISRGCKLAVAASSLKVATYQADYSKA